MAIVKMSRFNLTAFASDREALLTGLQSLGDVHFGDLTVEPTFDVDEGDPDAVKPAWDHLYEIDGVSCDGEAGAVTRCHEALQKVRGCIDLLETVAERPKGLAAFNNAQPEWDYTACETAASEVDWEPIYQTVQALNQKRQAAKDAVQAAKEANRQLRHYEKLDISPDALAHLKTATAVLGYFPKRWKATVEEGLGALDHTHVEVLSVDDKSVYAFILYDAVDAEAVEDLLRTNAFTRENLSGEALLSDRIAAHLAEMQANEAAVVEVEKELAACAEQHLDTLKLVYESLANAEVRAQRRDCFLRTERTVVMEGYVPTDQADALRQTVAACCQSHYDLTVTAVERDDLRVLDVPVKLNNNGLVSPFESIIRTYSTPRYDELDPTPLVMPWYCLSFGIMMGDLGYGLVMLILTTLALKCFKLKKSSRQFLRFFQVLSVPTIIAGACFGSCFALSFPSLIDPTVQYMPFLIFSVVIGYFMLMTGLGIKAYLNIRDGKPLDAVYDVLFWFMTLNGAIAMLLAGMLSAPGWVSTAGVVIMVIGIVGIWLFSARENKKLFPRLAWGLYNVYGLSSWIGDFVSYTRIAALALSGAFIGYAINLIAGGLLHSVIGFIPALIILVGFHAFNLFLSGLSGYVHTMRLVYVEFFGKFFNGGGKAFERFRAPSVYLDIK